MRVILDTNILLICLISPAGLPAQLVQAWLERRYTLISHELQLAEFRDVTKRQKVRAFIKPFEAGRLVNQINALAELPVRLPPVIRSRDPRDDFLLALCEAGRADWLVTGDKEDLLALSHHGSSKIVTAARLSRELTLS